MEVSIYMKSNKILSFGFNSTYSHLRVTATPVAVAFLQQKKSRSHIQELRGL
jgi:hypothetical protein